MAKGHGQVIRWGAFAPAFFREPLVAAIILALGAGLALFVVLPLLIVFKASIQVDGGYTLSRFAELFAHPAYFKPLWNSLKIGAACALTGTFVGYLLAYATTMTDLPFRKFFTSMGTLPIIAPPFMMALAAIMLFGHNGFVAQHLFAIPSIYGFWGLLIVQTISYFPTAFLLLISVFQSIDPVLLESARNQGAGPFRVFKDIVLPLSVPGIFSSMLLLFIESLADFGNPLILSGDYKVLSVEAYLKITGEYDPAGGATLAMLLLVPSLVAFLVQKYVVDRRSFATLTGKPSSSSRPVTSRGGRIFAVSVASAIAAVVVLFFGAVTFGSLVQVWGANHAFTLSNYTIALERSWGALWDSIVLALISAPITGLLGMLTAYLLVRKSFPGRGVMEFTSMLTFAVPGTVVGIGYVLAFNQPPITLTGTATIIVILMIFRNLPLGIQAGMTAIRQIDRAIEEGSANLGAGSMTTFRRVVLPLIAPALFSGLAQSFVRAMTAISALIFVVSGQWNLITVSILGYVENSQLSQASALSMLLVLIVSGVLALMNAITSRMGVRR